MARRISEDGLRLIKRWEGLRLEAYNCPAGVLTIGYGHTRNVEPGQRISGTEADRLLRSDISIYETAVSDMVGVPLSDNQFAALVSWAFNIGHVAARRSTLIRKLNSGDYDAVPAELMRWNRIKGKVVSGLTNRRAAEAGLWARGSDVASNYIEPTSSATTVAEVVRDTGTGRAAMGVGIAGMISTISQASPIIESLGAAGPAVGLALVAAAVMLFVLWRRGRI